MPLQIPSNEGNYGVIGRDEVPSDKIKDDFWHEVKRTLQEVFGKDGEPADRLRTKLQDAAADTQTAFYHSAPFNVAADLAGVEHVTTEQKRAYVQAISLEAHPRDAELAIEHPER